MMMKYSKLLLWMIFYLTKKKNLKIKIKKHRKHHVGFNHGFNTSRKKTVAIVV